jgi:hypothetical protein
MPSNDLCLQARNNVNSIGDVFNHPNLHNRLGISLIARLTQEQCDEAEKMTNLVSTLSNRRNSEPNQRNLFRDVIINIAADKAEAFAHKTSRLKTLAGEISDLQTQPDPVISRLFISIIYSEILATEFSQKAREKQGGFT